MREIDAGEGKVTQRDRIRNEKAAHWRMGNRRIGKTGKCEIVRSVLMVTGVVDRWEDMGSLIMRIDPAMHCQTNSTGSFGHD